MLFRSRRARAEDPDPAQVAKRAMADGVTDLAAGSEPLATLEVLNQTAIATVTVGELTGPLARRLINDLLTEFAEAHVRHFVFDLQNVTYMDSACIGAMVEMLTRLQGAGGRIALVNAGQSVSYLFKLTRLDRLFPICKDVMQAIAAVERR
ncbi:MAG: anti-sigma factor antagonist [Planctomycetota bacterium]|nr:MAG: anti-sigma factor antagonist [Planctomycetota bacterium]